MTCAAPWRRSVCRRLCRRRRRDGSPKGGDLSLTPIERSHTLKSESVSDRAPFTTARPPLGGTPQQKTLQSRSIIPTSLPSNFGVSQ